MSDVIRAKFQLKCQLFPALFHKDENKDKYQIIKSDEKVSEYMFPMIVQVIKRGSRAEQVYLDFSDIDYIYEVGPILVGRKKQFKKTFYFDTAKTPGFYTVSDEKGGYLYPMSLQSSFAPVIHGVKKIASLQTTSAALPSIPLPPGTLQQISNGLGMELFKQPELYCLKYFGMRPVQSNEDSVIALKCQKWPKDIWKKFKNRQPGNVSLQQLKGDLIWALILTSNFSSAQYFIVVLYWFFISKINICQHTRKIYGNYCYLKSKVSILFIKVV